MGVLEYTIKRKKISKSFGDILKVCRNLLYNHPVASDALTYLENRVSKLNQAKFEFGYFPSDQYLDLLINTVGKEKLIETGLVYSKYIADGNHTIATLGKLNYHNLIMPIKDVHGNIIAFSGRCILDDDNRKALPNVPKYKTTSFTKSINLFGLYEAKTSIINSNYVIIVEGQFDCITARENGLHNVVALCGATLSPYQFYLLTRYTDNIFLMLDNDDEGIAASNKIKDTYSKYANIQQIEIPKQYKDLDQCLKNSSWMPHISI